MNIVGLVRSAICHVMGVDKTEIFINSNLEEDLGMDDDDIETVLGLIERKLKVDLIDFYDPSEIKTAGQLARLIKEQVEI